MKVLPKKWILVKSMGPSKSCDSTSLSRPTKASIKRGYMVGDM